ncbi:ArsR/SmtB family transcription factor [Planobispora longispora]|uniref:Transcriptional regulator n=1 Tax=Planobispora longispora TaxID=28887 RepID=A0A8J3RPW5_9ACTN|nr:metalloregulator ArsR/SmtB family transcription factor [Planobispora longispora]GIH77742.1 transcriptional regulator [Planobispora longispora]
MAEDRLSLVFAALADPTRRALLLRLIEGDATVAELAAPFDVSQPAISRHLKVLENAGLISRTRRATARLSHLEAEPLREVTTWLARYQRFWDESHERLDELLVVLQGGRDETPGRGEGDESVRARGEDNGQDADHRGARPPADHHHP